MPRYLRRSQCYVGYLSGSKTVPMHVHVFEIVYPFKLLTVGDPVILNSHVNGGIEWVVVVKHLSHLAETRLIVPAENHHSMDNNRTMSPGGAAAAGNLVRETINSLGMQIMQEGQIQIMVTHSVRIRDDNLSP